MKAKKPMQQTSAKQAKKAGAPKPQMMPSTPPSKAESKTAKPAKGRKVNTPPVAFAPRSPERKTKMAKM